MRKNEFMQATGNPRTLRQALGAMQALRAAGHIVKRQDVKTWFGNQSPASHNLTRA